MGACNCGERSTEPEQVVDVMEKVPGSQTLAAVEEAQIEDLQSQNDNEPLYSKNEVETIQNSIRSYIDRKRIQRLADDMLLIPDDPDAHADPSVDYFIGNFLDLLSEPARSTFSRVSRLVLDKQVKNTVSLGTKRLVETGDIYIGQWAVRTDGLPVRQGKGKLITTQGALFEGYWRSGHLHHLGRIIYHNGDYFEGRFEKGMRVGQGRFETFERKTVYIGAWENDVRHGYGIETFDDGARYEGQFTEDRKTGKGRFLWKDGSSYDGDFIDGKLEGHGTYRWYDKREYTGSWKDGKMNGFGKFTYKDGKTYEGEYVNDKKQGYGVYKWEGQEYAGDWLNGKMHGFGYLTSSKGKKRYQFDNGNKIREAPE